MRIVYQNTFLDVFSFHIYALPRQRAMQIMALVIGLFLGHTLWSAARNLEGTVGMKVFVFAVMTSLVFAAILAMVLGSTALSVFFNRSRHILGEHSICLTEEGVVESTPLGRQETTWGGIHHIARTRRFILLFITPASAHLVPTRAFANSQDADRFFELAKRSSLTAQVQP